MRSFLIREDSMPTPLVVALASGTGGIAPSLVHLAQGFLKQSPDVPGLF